VLSLLLILPNKNLQSNSDQPTANQIYQFLHIFNPKRELSLKLEFISEDKKFEIVKQESHKERRKLIGSFLNNSP